MQSDAYAGAQTTRAVPDNRSDRRRLPQQACQPDETDKTRAAPNNHAIADNMPDIPEKYKTLREITEAIAKADDEIIEQHQVSTQRAKRYGSAVTSQRRVRRRQITSSGAHRESDGGFLEEAAHHDVKHAIHKAEHRLAEARCQAVFKQRPFLQHLDKARDAAATQGHAKRSQHTVEAGPWRAAVVAQLG